MDFSEMYGRYARDLYRFHLFLSGSSMQAEDLTTKTLARALGAVAARQALGA